MQYLISQKTSGFVVEQFDKPENAWAFTTMEDALDKIKSLYRPSTRDGCDGLK